MNKEQENKDIGSDLCRLAILLQQHDVCRDIGPLQRAGSACMSNATSTLWAYNLDKMVFNADAVGGRMAADSTDITVSLSIVIKGKITNTKEIYNPLIKLTFDLEIEGMKPSRSDNAFEFLYSAWHLDRHIFDSEDGKTKYCHPLYHFAFGGDKMAAKGHDIYGNSLILPSPRLVYPPMDAVLGIDFILQNYIHKNKIRHLVEDSKYIEIQKKSQYRIWKPFFCSIYSHWNDSTYSIESDFSPSKLFPLYY
jgi:hypothetical protein